MKKKLIAALLCAVLLLSVLTVSATAQEKKTFLCIGDSIGAGMGLTVDGESIDFSEGGTPQEQWTMGAQIVVTPNSFPVLTADALNYKLVQCSRSAVRACDIRYLLDGTYNNLPEGIQYSATLMDINGDSTFSTADLDTLDEMMGDLSEQVKNADVICVQVGNNDVLTQEMFCLLQDENSPFKSDFSDMNAETVLNLLKSVKNYSDLFSGFMEKYIENYSAIMKTIYTLNPDAEVYCVGLYNCTAYFYLDDNQKLSSGALTEGVTKEFNAIIKGICAKYANACYVDVMGTETYAMSSADFSKGLMIEKVHPTKAGQSYMAQKLIAACQNTDITVKVKNAQQISDVAVDYYKNVDAAFDAATQTVKISYNGKTAKRVTLEETRANGDIYRTTYVLCYGKNGYTATKLLSLKVEDAELKQTVTEINNKIRTKLQNLFTK